MIRRWFFVWALCFCCPLAAWADSTKSMLQEVMLPQDGQAPYATVLLLHGCHGIDRNIPMWQEFLRANGYASVAVDSFKNRAITEICTDFRRLPMFERVNDAYKALAQLTQRPDVDPQRVVVMGFSNGGIATLSALTQIVGTQLPKNHARFRAGIAVYPDCGHFAYAGFTQPVLVLIGEVDDWTPPAACVALASKFANKEPTFETIVYPKAHHGFDIPDLPYRYWGNATNMNKPNGYGATIEGNDNARKKSMNDAMVFLNRLFKTPEAKAHP